MIHQLVDTVEMQLVETLFVQEQENYFPNDRKVNNSKVHFAFG